MGRIFGWAFQLDQWLKQNLGRPYTVILGVSLGLGISVNVKSLEQLFDSPAPPSLDRFAVLAGTALVQVALLINQLAQLYEYRQYSRAKRAERREAKAARKAAKTDAKPGGDPGPAS